MEDMEMINLWKSYDKKLEESLLLNRQNAEDITRLKVQSFLASMKPLKVFTLMIGIVWVGIGSSIVINLLISASAMVSIFFLISAGLQLVITAIAIVVYLYQLVLIYQTDISKPILEIQEQLAHLKASTLWIARILFLQLPLWTTFYLSESMFENGNVALYLIQGCVTLSFIYIALWLFVNINHANRDKKWFRLIFNGNEWSPLLKAMDLLDQIQEYKTDRTDENASL